MIKSNSNAAILSVALDRSAKQSLQRQIIQALRDFVHRQILVPGDMLPPSRVLARELSVSRTTITVAYDQLIAEGYLEGRVGSGIFVTKNLTDYPFAERTTSVVSSVDASEVYVPSLATIRPFENGIPDVEEFPYKEWGRHLEATWKSVNRSFFGRSDPLGWWPLRQAIASHLATWRNLSCSASQIVITSGLNNALEIFAATALSQGDHVLVEDPSHYVLRNTLRRTGMHVEAVRVDEKGFNVEYAENSGCHAKAIVVTPSRHFPLGMTLPLSKRLGLLSWATRFGGYILEDDFDGEYRYQGLPLPAMMSLDSGGRVIYIGSFSKVMFPGLRLGYMVLPPKLCEPACRYIEQIGVRAAMTAQPALAQFIETGGFATHLRKMRRLYITRQKCLLAAIAQHTPELFHVQPEQSGMHVTAYFTASLSAKMSDKQAVQIAARAGIRAQALSTFFDQTADIQGLVLGYAAFKEDILSHAFSSLASALIDGQKTNVLR